MANAFDIEEECKNSGTTSLTQDLRNAIAILERLRFKVGPEFLRKDITKAIKLIENGLPQ